MKYNITVDKKVDAVIDRRLCINCGDCRQVCPTQAIEEYQKTVSCLFPRGQEKAGAQIKSFADAKNQALETVCSIGCPLGIIPQAVAALVKEGNLEGAYHHIAERNSMPWVCAMICDHICQESCKRGAMVDQPLNMRAIEKYVLSKNPRKPLQYIKRFHEKIAIVGGGPAGISAAHYLAKLGYEVTIFEKDHSLGGALYWGIPAFRLHKKKLKEEIDRIIDAGIDVRYGCCIGENYTLDEIWQEGFSACLLAVGTSYGMKPDIAGADGATVYDGVQVMRQITGGQNEGVIIGDKVVIVGGGGFAADIARVIKRMGKDVLCAAVEETGDLQISKETVDALAEEGIEVRTLVMPKQIITESGNVKAVEFIKTEYIEDERGRRRANPIKGSSFNYFCDTVIFAVGQRCSVGSISKVETYPDGKVKIDAHHRTNKDRIFACGDATGESGSVAEAMAAGKQAAMEIDGALQGMRDLKRTHIIRNASDGQSIYPENIQRIKPQFESVIREDAGTAERFDASDADDAEAMADGTSAEIAKSVKTPPAEDVFALLRSVGIEEDLSELFAAADIVYNNDAYEARRKVAVIGGGMAGVAAAVSLVRKGFAPTIFEKTAGLGGTYRWFSTEKRLDKEILVKALAQVEAAGIEVIYNVSAGIRPTINEIFRMGFEAALFAVGKAGERSNIKNADCGGVFEMTALMGKLADHERLQGIGKKVVIIGSDGMAFDLARNLKEPGREVSVLVPCSKGRLRIHAVGFDAALEEGINLITGVELSSINAEKGHVFSVDCKVLDKNFPINVPCDTLVLPSSDKPDTETIAIRNLKLDVDKDGHIVTDDNLATSIPGVFAINDFEKTSGDAGRAGAAAIDMFLAGGSEFIVISGGEKKELSPEYEIIEGNKIGKPLGFETGREVYSDEQALVEASRCMKCGYHKENAADCMGCGVCVRTCPVNAISLVSAKSHSQEV